MPELTRATRRQLLDALAAIPVLATSAGRDRLARDLPPALAAQIPRQAATLLDLDQLVAACDTWPAPPGQEPPLLTLIENAHDLMRGSQAGHDLARLRALLYPPATVEPPPRCPYPGLRRFGPDDADVFGGREAEVAA